MFQLVDWFYSMSALVRLFNVTVNLIVKVSNYTLYKNVSSQSFQTGKHFAFSCNIHVLRANIIYFKIIVNIISNRSIWPIHETLTGTTTLSQSGPKK